MRNVYYFVVLATTGLVFYHSYQAWYWMSGEWYTALGWAVVIDSLAVLFWSLGENKKAKIATSLVVTIAFIHLASPIMSKLDLSSFASEAKEKDKALIDIGKGASKFGNHKGVNLVLKELSKEKKTSKKDEKGGLETGKMIVSTIVMMVSLIMAVSGQVFFIGELRKLYQKEEDDDILPSKDEPRKTVASASDAELAKVALKELNQCRVRFGGISEGELANKIEGVSAPAFSKARATLRGETESSKCLKRDGLIMLIQRLRQAKPLPS